ncbi:MAG: hypothetical protein RH949_30005 [Coleofasciculus sp. A1-SPW-01]|uniref:hypothetical protein n=1 Tax=Coleofasciculus sp. A1-SPW-01 TaxID=3070819 RepID=UPI0033032C85
MSKNNRSVAQECDSRYHIILILLIVVAREGTLANPSPTINGAIALYANDPT